MSETKKFRVTFNEITTRVRVIELDSKDAEHAKVMIERVPEQFRAPRFYREISNGAPSTVDEVTKVEEVKS